jgi:hypothetical protein
MPGEQLLPFEGAGFTTTWTLQLPKAANAVGLHRVTDVRIAFDLQAAYDVASSAAPVAPQPASRATFVSALATDPAGLATLSKAGSAGRLRLALDKIALPPDSVVTNVAVLLPGVNGGTFSATLRYGTGAATSFQIDNGVAMSNAGGLSDGIPANARPLNAATGGSPARPVNLTIRKGNDGTRLAQARDVLLWIEFEVP